MVTSNGYIVEKVDNFYKPGLCVSFKGNGQEGQAHYTRLHAYIGVKAAEEVIEHYARESL